MLERWRERGEGGEHAAAGVLLLCCWIPGAGVKQSLRRLTWPNTLTTPSTQVVASKVAAKAPSSKATQKLWERPELANAFDDIGPGGTDHALSKKDWAARAAHKEVRGCGGAARVGFHGTACSSAVQGVEDWGREGRDRRAPQPCVSQLRLRSELCCLSDRRRPPPPGAPRPAPGARARRTTRATSTWAWTPAGGPPCSTLTRTPADLSTCALRTCTEVVERQRLSVPATSLRPRAPRPPPSPPPPPHP